MDAKHLTKMPSVHQEITEERSKKQRHNGRDMFLAYLVIPHGSIENDIHLHTNILQKSVNPSLLPLAMGKIVVLVSEKNLYFPKNYECNMHLQKK